MPPAPPPWPAPDAPAAAPGPTSRPPAAPPSRAGPPPRRAPAPPPSTPRPCGCSTARRRAAAPPGGPAACRAAPASGPSASSRCAVAGRRARPDRRRCTAPAASRPTAPRTRSSRPPRPPRDPSPAARSPGRAGPSGRPPRRGTAPPAPPRSSVPPPPPRVRLPQAEAQPTGCVTPQEPSPNTSAGNRITVRPRHDTPLEDGQQTLEGVGHTLSAEPGDLMAHPHLEERFLPGPRGLLQPVALHRTAGTEPAVRPRTRRGTSAAVARVGSSPRDRREVLQGCRWSVLALAQQPLLPPVPPRVGAARPPPKARCPRRQLRRRLRDLLPTRQRGGGARDDAAVDGAARADGERGEDTAGLLAGGQLRLPRLRDRSLPRQGRDAVRRHAPVA